MTVSDDSDDAAPSSHSPSTTDCGEPSYASKKHKHTAASGNFQARWQVLNDVHS